ncbi:MAG: tRNA pseudouridine(55) synthase TruB [Thermodesulfovibrionales bacterium]
MNIVINLNKPKGITSQQAVSKIKRIFGARKAGHAGTLDPIATGVLLVCLGEATKVARFLSDLDKEYIAVMKLGERTTTYDSEGEVIRRVGDFSLERKGIEDVIERFKGTTCQTPPMYSAVKINGKPLYKLARKGITVERPQRMVVIHRIEIIGFDLPFLEIRVSCSKGTYIRTLCDDIGEALGVGAHITELKRTRIGDFRIEDSATIEDLENLLRKCHAELVSASLETLKRVQGDIKGVLPAVQSIDSALKHLAELVLTEAEFTRAKQGLSVSCPNRELSGEYIRLKDPSGSLFAIGRIENSVIKIERMLHLSSNIKPLF